MVGVGQLKITNIRSLSPSMAPQPPAAVENGHHSVSTLKCLMCFDDVMKHKLLDHLFSVHFAFYRPLKCKSCDLLFGDVDVYIGEHHLLSGHQDGCILVGKRSTYVERIVKLLYNHCVRMNLGDDDNVLKNLDEIKLASMRYSANCIANNGNIPVLNGSVGKKDSPTTSNLPSSSSETHKRRGSSPPNDNRIVKRRRRPSDVRRTLVPYYLCKMCPSFIHKDERQQHVREKHNPTFAEIILTGSDPWNACFGDVEESMQWSDGEDDTSETTSAVTSKNVNEVSSTTFVASEAVQNGALGTSAVVQPLEVVNSDLSGSTAAVVAINNLNVTSDDSNSNRSSPAQLVVAVSATDAQWSITCDFCSKVCENKDILKQHSIEHHSGGFIAFSCDACSFVSPNQRHMIDHCRKEHKNAKLLRRRSPSEEQAKLLLAIRDSLADKGIPLDLTMFGVASA